MLPAALSNPEGNISGGRECCTALLFCPFVGTSWAKHKRNICYRSYIEAEGTEAVLRAGHNSPSLLGDCSSSPGVNYSSLLHT